MLVESLQQRRWSARISGAAEKVQIRQQKVIADSASQGTVSSDFNTCRLIA
jgi:hypothetical protein